MGCRQIVNFEDGRNPQGDVDFVRGCKLDRSWQGTRIALGVRRVIAELGEVEPALIHAEDLFDGPIASLPFWDSLDSVELVMTIEEEFDVTIPNYEAEKIRNPEVAPCTVGEFVADVYRVVAPKMAVG